MTIISEGRKIKITKRQLRRIIREQAVEPVTEDQKEKLKTLILTKDPRNIMQAAALADSLDFDLRYMIEKDPELMDAIKDMLQSELDEVIFPSIEAALDGPIGKIQDAIGSMVGKRVYGDYAAASAVSIADKVYQPLLDYAVQEFLGQVGGF
jgi:hypothetical protein